MLRSLPSLPRRRQVVEQYQLYLSKVVNYRRQAGMRVDGSHLLVRFLGSLNVSMGLRDEPYLWAVSDLALMLASALRITSVWGAGRMQRPGVFYGEGIDEVIIGTIDSFDLTDARTTWETLMPIRVLSHPYNDFTLPFLDGSGRGVTGSGRAVWVVNLAMLAFQHKCWWERFVATNPDSPPTVEQFLVAYPLTNALASHLDGTMANRLMSRALNRPVVTQTDANPFYIGYQRDIVDHLLDEALEYMQKRALSFDDWISAMPMITVGDYHTWLALPELAYMTQVEWAIFLARLPILGFLLAFNQQQHSSYNAQYITRIKHWVRRMRQGRLFNQALHGQTANDVLATIEQTIDPYL